MATRRQESYRGKGRMREEPLLTWSQETALEKTNPGCQSPSSGFPNLQCPDLRFPPISSPRTFPTISVKMMARELLMGTARVRSEWSEWKESLRCKKKKSLSKHKTLSLHHQDSFKKGVSWSHFSDNVTAKLRIQTQVSWLQIQCSLRIPARRPKLQGLGPSWFAGKDEVFALKQNYCDLKDIWTDRYPKAKGHNSMRQ